MTRIAVGGFLHETNTFAPTKATYDAFLHGGGFPRMEMGDGILKNVRRINVGLAGFIEAAEAEGWTSSRRSLRRQRPVRMSPKTRSSALRKR